MQAKRNPSTTNHHDVRATRPRAATQRNGNTYAVRMWVRQFNMVRVLQHQPVPVHAHA